MSYDTKENILVNGVWQIIIMNTCVTTFFLKLDKNN